MRRTLSVSGGAVIALILIAALAVAAGGRSSATAPGPGDATPASATKPHDDDGHAAEAHTKPAAMRTLIVYLGAEPAPSSPGAVMRALRLSGPTPNRAVATVLSDEDCAPDGAGVSHCRNAVRLPSGRTLTLRHPHRMADVPCMTPGERVRVVRAT